LTRKPADGPDPEQLAAAAKLQEYENVVGNGRALHAALMHLCRTREDNPLHPCWCDMAIGHPNVPTHTHACRRARAAVGVAP
jgi:hypothetical protein